MTKTAAALILASLTIACSGVRAKDDTRMPTDYAAAPSSLGEKLQVVESEVVMTHDPEVTLPAPVPVPTPAPVPDPPEAVGQADLEAVDGSGAAGTITFSQSKGKITIIGTFTGLKPGLRGLQVHAKSDCRAQAMRAGKHFNPSKAKHGPPESAQRHAGDFGNLVVDEHGAATFSMITDSITVTAGPDSVVGLAIVVHTRKDDGRTQPNGNSGTGAVCGVIELKPTLLAGE